MTIDHIEKVIIEPIKDNLKELIIAKTNEEFKGISGIEYNNDNKPESSLTHSNYPRALFADQILFKAAIKRRIPTLIQLIRYWHMFPEQGTAAYFHTNAITVYPNNILYEHLKEYRYLRTRALSILGLEKIEIPLIIQGIGIKRDTESGFTFTETDHIEAIEALFLTKIETKLIYDPNLNRLVESESGILVWAQEQQAGVCGICRKLGRIYAFLHEPFEAFETGKLLSIRSLESRLIA